MNTTNMLVEIIVVGVFGFLWVGPIMLNCFDAAYLQNFFELNIKSIIVFLAIIYFLGAISNFIADKLFFCVDKYIVKGYGSKAEIRKNRSKIIVSSSDAACYLFQRRSFVRIFRANSMNLFFGAVAVYFDIGRLGDLFSFDKNNLSLFLFVFSVLSFIAYTITLSGYFSYINEAGGICER